MGLKDLGIHGVPIIVKPFVHALAFLLAAPIMAYRVLVKPTLRIKYIGDKALFSQQGVVFCHWHESIPCGLILFDYRHIALLFHPKLYMLPIYYLYRVFGCQRFVFGSSGNSGRAAQDEMVRALRAGFSTVVNPDGPQGPIHRLKPGFFHLAANSGAPVVPFHVDCRWRYVSGAWDRKWWPLPFARLVVTIGEPQTVNPESDREAFQVAVAAAMSR